jgi:serpin B
VLQFRKAVTREEPFFLEGGGQVQAPLMHQRSGFWYLQAGDFQAVELDYRDSGLSMLLLLPDKKDGLRDLETKLSPRMFHDCVANMVLRDLELFLPRFRMTWGTIDLEAQLRTLGMPLAFTRFQADFSGITGREATHEDPLFLSGVLHKALVEVNEEGTEAAAATSVLADLSASAWKPPPVPIFRADHSFLFAIRDRRTSAILFLGRVADPTKET